jgi:nucleotide-binding universal stress UspA family protein
MTDAAPAPDCNIPAPTSEQRDALGRRVALTWCSTPHVPTGPAWLVAVDGSPCALRAVDAVARLVALGQGQRVDIVHVQSWLSKEAAEVELARQGWALSASARQRLDRAAIAWQLHVHMGEAAADIAQLAERLDSLGIVVGSHGLTAARSVLLGSVAYQVLDMARRPVLIVR